MYIYKVAKDTYIMTKGNVIVAIGSSFADVIDNYIHAISLPKIII